MEHGWIKNIFRIWSNNRNSNSLQKYGVTISSLYIDFAIQETTVILVVLWKIQMNTEYLTEYEVITKNQILLDNIMRFQSNNRNSNSLQKYGVTISSLYIDFAIQETTVILVVLWKIQMNTEYLTEYEVITKNQILLDNIMRFQSNNRNTNSLQKSRSKTKPSIH